MDRESEFNLKSKNAATHRPAFCGLTTRPLSEDSTVGLGWSWGGDDQGGADGGDHSELFDELHDVYSTEDGKKSNQDGEGNGILAL